MDFFEQMFYGRGYQRIAGIDEVGRGPLAGPVVAAAVILPRDGIGQPLFDSKKISAKKRDELYGAIFSKALGVGVGVVEREEIDEVNIFQASLKAMALAVKALHSPPDFLLIDGRHTINVRLPQKSITKGDQLSVSVAAASIVAKVTRDRLMDECHRKYPVYDFDKHKGYGTKAHRMAIEKYGICEFHRRSFKGVKEFLTR